MEDVAMTTAEERMRILNLVEEGRLDPDQAAQLLSAMGEQDATIQEPMAEPAARVGGRWLRVRVTDGVTGKRKVSVNVPMGIVKLALRIGTRFAPELNDIDMNELQELIDSGATGKIVEVDDSVDGERVEIFIE
jgi:hypothetical protein